MPARHGRRKRHRSVRREPKSSLTGTSVASPDSGGLGGVGAGAAFLTPEIAETLSQTARSGYVYGRRAMRLDDAVSAANGTDREGR